MPVEFYFGNNIIQKNGTVIKEIGERAFIVTGKNSAKKSGALDDIIKILEELNISYVQFSEINQNPEIEVIYRAVEIFKKEELKEILLTYRLTVEELLEELVKRDFIER